MNFSQEEASPVCKNVVNLQQQQQHFGSIAFVDSEQSGDFLLQQQDMEALQLQQQMPTQMTVPVPEISPGTLAAINENLPTEALSGSGEELFRQLPETAVDDGGGDGGNVVIDVAVPVGQNENEQVVQEQGQEQQQVGKNQALQR